MAKIIPFTGLLYNPEKVAGDEVVAPPYDVISPECRETLYQKNPYNIVRVDFGKELPGDSGEDNRYTRARESLDQWSREGILIRDDRPAFYAYEIEYRLGGESKVLRGILALVKIEELGKGVHPHEETHSKPKADRLNLMKSCLANISPIYSLYHSPERITSRILESVGGTPYFSARGLDGAVHKLYKITDEAKFGLIMRELYDKPLFIADGHHRYEVALEFKKEMDALGHPNTFFPECAAGGSRPWEYVLMFLANISDEGISVLPTHRLVKGISRKEEIMRRLDADFSIRQAPITDDITKTLTGEGKGAFGLYLDNEDHWYILKCREKGQLKDVPPALRNLDVVVLHELILKRDLWITEIAYEMDVKEAVGKVRRGDFDGVFFLNPTGVEEVERVALSHLRMPPKSTYFYPKLLTGMVINRLKTNS
ncbi:MAG: DUF1015 domain-containing protein [Nitrospirales bacterium]|nr:DUF1015 domain-containing protein [Nitrospirales bacterium]